MVRGRARLGTTSLAILVLGTAGFASSWTASAFAQQPTGSSWTQSITSGFKKGVDKVGKTLNPNPSKVDSISDSDPTSLKTKATPSPELYVALARVYEQGGKKAEAEQQYQIALQHAPNDLQALLGYALFLEGAGKTNEAIKLYQRAIQAHPQDASAYNNLGLCHARQNRLDEAVAAMGRAAQLDPENALYRNNIATVLVDQGKTAEAMKHLRAVHSDAVAQFNLGYLLNKKGQSQAALQHFHAALKSDPSMENARCWVAYLEKTNAVPRVTPYPMAAGVKVAASSSPPRETAPMPRGAARKVFSVPDIAEETAPLPPSETPRRLPPAVLRQPLLDGPRLPGICYDPATAPMAPMPPATVNSALRPLPRAR